MIAASAAYAVLDDLRPLFGCESCGPPSLWARPLRWLIKKARLSFGGSGRHDPAPHFSPRPIEARDLTR